MWCYINVSVCKNLEKIITGGTTSWRAMSAIKMKCNSVIIGFSCSFGSSMKQKNRSFNICWSSLISWTEETCAAFVSSCYQIQCSSPWPMGCPALTSLLGWIHKPFVNAWVSRIWSYASRHVYVFRLICEHCQKGRSVHFLSLGASSVCQTGQHLSGYVSPFRKQLFAVEVLDLGHQPQSESFALLSCHVHFDFVLFQSRNIEAGLMFLA